MKSAFVTLLLVFALAYETNAATIHVPADQPTIQAAIDASASGDTVLVAPGTYYEDINFFGDLMHHARPDVRRSACRPELDEGKEHRATILRVRAGIRQPTGL